MVRCWSATSRRNALISASSSVDGPTVNPRSTRACTTQRRSVSEIVIPSCFATSGTLRSRSRISSIARRRSSSEYFRGRPMTHSLLLRARRPRNEHCIKPGVARSQPGLAGPHARLRSINATGPNNFSCHRKPDRMCRGLTDWKWSFATTWGSGSPLHAVRCRSAHTISSEWFAARLARVRTG